MGDRPEELSDSDRAARNLQTAAQRTHSCIMQVAIAKMQLSAAREEAKTSDTRHAAAITSSAAQHFRDTERNMHNAVAAEIDCHTKAIELQLTSEVQGQIMATVTAQQEGAANAEARRGNNT